MKIDSSGAYPMSQRSVLVIQDPEDPEDAPEVNDTGDIKEEPVQLVSTLALLDAQNLLKTSCKKD